MSRWLKYHEEHPELEIKPIEPTQRRDWKRIRRMLSLTLFVVWIAVIIFLILDPPPVNRCDWEFWAAGIDC